MRKAAATLTLATSIAALSLASNATAQPEYANRIPNGSSAVPATCEFCHPGGNTTLKNAFGLESEIFLGKPAATWWPGLRDKDSDGDGQTNAQELGDPCHDWTIGAMPGRTGGISNPGEKDDVSATPDVPTCDGSGGAGGAPTTTTSDPTTTGGSPTGGTTTTTSNPNPAGGQGGDGDGGSIGAGKADPPPSTNPPGSCSIASAPASTSEGGHLAVAFFAAIALFLGRAARPRRSK